MSSRPTSEEATRALQSLLAAAFPNGHAPSSDSIPYPTSTINGHGSSSTSGGEESHQTSGDGTPQTGEDLLNALSAISSTSTADPELLHSHTMALLAAQPSLLPGLTFAPPSPGPRTRAASASISSAAAHQHRPSTNTSNYTPLPTRSGRVPQVPDHSTTAEPARETMLFNDYFDWPSSDDEDDPDFQPQAVWSDIVVGQGGGVFSNDEDGDEGESDFSMVDEGFTPGDSLAEESYVAGLGADDILVGVGGASTSRIPLDPFRPSDALPLDSGSRRAPTSSSSPAAFAPPPPRRPKPASKTKASTQARKRPRTTLSPLPEDPADQPTFALPPSRPLSSTFNHSSLYAPIDSPAAFTLGGSDAGAALVNALQAAAVIPPTPAPIVPPATTTNGTATSAVVPPPAKAKAKAKANATTPPTTSSAAPTPAPAAPGEEEAPKKRKVRGRGKRQLAMTEEQLNEERKARQRRTAREAREKKRKLLQTSEQRIEELEGENGRLKKRVEELEGRLRDGGLGVGEAEAGGSEAGDRRGRYDASFSGSASREGSWAVESVADSVEDDEQQEEEEDQLAGDEGGQAATGVGGGGAAGGQEGAPPAFDLTGLSAEGLEELRKLLLVAARANGAIVP